MGAGATIAHVMLDLAATPRAGQLDLSLDITLQFREGPTKTEPAEGDGHGVLRRPPISGDPHQAPVAYRRWRVRPLLLQSSISLGSDLPVCLSCAGVPLLCLPPPARVT